MNTTVTFEIAKLLKEKGFDNESCDYYNIDGELRYDSEFPSLQCTKYFDYYDAPTIAEVVMWIYEKHGIWISVVMLYPKRYEYDIQKTDSTTQLAKSHPQLDTPTEACNEAILYTLNNLI